MTDQAVRVLIFLADRGIVDFLESILMSAGCGGLCARVVYFFSSRGRHTISLCDWSADVCSSDLIPLSPVSEPTLFQGSGKRGSGEPLAARMRPTSLEDFLGQEHLLGPGKALGELIRRGDVGSCIFWGPPGSGKTTLARLVANYTARQFEPFSAVTEGVARVREIIQQAEERLKYEGRGTILFCDEIHRFNRAQQDAFLPWVENGIITLIGATTENPSFELTAPLLSRCRVFVFEPLNDEH